MATQNVSAQATESKAPSPFLYRNTNGDLLTPDEIHRHQNAAAELIAAVADLCGVHIESTVISDGEAGRLRLILAAMKEAEKSLADIYYDGDEQ